MVQLDGNGRVAVSVPCVSCGYDLRGLSPDGECPECGASIQTSIDSQRLFFTSPRWLGGVRASVLTHALGVLTMPMCLLVFPLILTGLGAIDLGEAVVRLNERSRRSLFLAGHSLLAIIGFGAGGLAFLTTGAALSPLIGPMCVILGICSFGVHLFAVTGLLDTLARRMQRRTLIQHVARTRIVLGAALTVSLTSFVMLGGGNLSSFPNYFGISRGQAAAVTLALFGSIGFTILWWAVLAAHFVIVLTILRRQALSALSRAMAGAGEEPEHHPRGKT